MISIFLRYIERIQSIILLVGILCLISCAEKKHSIIIGIQPFEKFNKAQLDTVDKTIHQVYGFKTIVLKEKIIPPEAFVKIKKPRYRADFLINYLKTIKPDTVDYIIGFTDKDISTTKRNKDHTIKKPESKYTDFGVFGLGYVNGPSCIVSSFWLSKAKDDKQFMDRLKKVCIHEIGHNLGLPHCPDKNCVMRDANESIKSIDGEKLYLCKKCKVKIN